MHTTCSLQYKSTKWSLWSTREVHYGTMRAWCNHCVMYSAHEHDCMSGYPGVLLTYSMPRIYTPDLFCSQAGYLVYVNGPVTDSTNSYLVLYCTMCNMGVVRPA